MMNRVNYDKHRYTGRKVNLKRSHAQLRQCHGPQAKSRADAWGSKHSSGSATDTAGTFSTSRSTAWRQATAKSEGNKTGEVKTYKRRQLQIKSKSQIDSEPIETPEEDASECISTHHSPGVCGNSTAVDAFKLAPPVINPPLSSFETYKAKPVAVDVITCDGERLCEVLEDEGEKYPDPLVEDTKPLACRCCLATERPLRPLDRSQASLYQQLTGKRVSRTDIYPKFLCSYCRALLLKFDLFKKKCLSAQASFRTLHSTGVPITLDMIGDIRQTPYPNLLMTESQIISITDVSVEFESVKNEAQNSFGILHSLLSSKNIPKTNDCIDETETTPVNSTDDIEISYDDIGDGNDFPDNDLCMDNDPNMDCIDSDFGNICTDNNLKDKSANTKIPDYRDDKKTEKLMKDLEKEKRKKLKRTINADFNNILQKSMTNPVTSTSSQPYRWSDDDLMGDGSKGEDMDMRFLHNDIEFINMASDSHIDDSCKAGTSTHAINTYKKAKIATFPPNVDTKSALNSTRTLYKLRKINLLGKVVPEDNRRIETEKMLNVKIVRLSLEDQMKQIKARKDSESFIEACYKCELCYTGFTAEADHNNHMAKHELSQGDHICAVCNLRFRSKKKLKDHGTCHLFNYICNWCGKVSKSRAEALHHHKWHNGFKYNCKKCGMTFDELSPVLAHIHQSHAGTEVCPICRATFKGKPGLVHHIGKIHKEAVGAVCGTCGVQFHSHDALRRHLPQDGIGSCDHTHRPCAACGEGFPTDQLLSEHKLEIHHQPSHTCEIMRCTKQCHSETELRDHMLLRHIFYGCQQEQQQEEILCEICGVSAKSAAGLAKHMRGHAGERSFQCEHCGKKYDLKCNLRNHMAVHMAPAQRTWYSCGECGKRFLISGSLRRHRITVHKAAKPSGSSTF